MKLPEKSTRTMWCGPHALAVLAGVPYDRAYDVALRGRRRWQRAYWKRKGIIKNPRLSTRIQGMSKAEMITAGKTLKITVKWFAVAGRPTLQRFAEMHTVKDVAYLVNVTDHYGVLINGRFIDQRGDNPVAECKFARSRMQNVAMIS